MAALLEAAAQVPDKSSADVLTALAQRLLGPGERSEDTPAVAADVLMPEQPKAHRAFEMHDCISNSDGISSRCKPSRRVKRSSCPTLGKRPARTASLTKRAGWGIDIKHKL